MISSLSSSMSRAASRLSATSGRSAPPSTATSARTPLIPSDAPCSISWAWRAAPRPTPSACTSSSWRGHMERWGWTPSSTSTSSAARSRSLASRSCRWWTPQSATRSWPWRPSVSEPYFFRWSARLSGVRELCSYNSCLCVYVWTCVHVWYPKISVLTPLFFFFFCFCFLASTVLLWMSMLSWEMNIWRLWK